MFRKMVFWEWYTDVNTTKLFLHCLLMANWRPGRWKGISYERGQFITSIDHLSKETGLTVQEVRTALDHLKATNEITSESTNRYTLITVVSFEKYQGEQQANQQTNNTQNNKRNNKQATNKQQQNKNNKNNKNTTEEVYKAPPEDDMDDEEDPYADIDESEWMEPDTLPRTYGRYGGINV